MGSGASQYKTKEEALAAGITEEQIAEYLEKNPTDGAAAASTGSTKADKKAAKKQAKEDKKAAKKQAKADKKTAKKEKKAAKKAAKKVFVAIYQSYNQHQQELHTHTHMTPLTTNTSD